MLVHYGFFCASPSVDDDIRLDDVILPTLSAEVTERLQDVGFYGSYALLPADNELCFKTQVAVRAMLLTCNEWEYFVASGEDLTVDCSREVDEYVKGLLRGYREEAVGKRELPGMIGARWGQIVDAIDAFLAT